MTMPEVRLDHKHARQIGLQGWTSCLGTAALLWRFGGRSWRESFLASVSSDAHSNQHQTPTIAHLQQPETQPHVGSETPVTVTINGQRRRPWADLRRSGRSYKCHTYFPSYEVLHSTNCWPMLGDMLLGKAAGRFVHMQSALLRAD